MKRIIFSFVLKRIIFSLILTLYNVIIYGDDIVTYYFLGIFIMEQNKKIEKEDQGAFSIKKQIIYIVVFVALIALTFYAIVSQNENLTLEGFLNYTFSLKMGWLIAAVMCVFLFILLEGWDINEGITKVSFTRQQIFISQQLHHQLPADNLPQLSLW